MTIPHAILQQEPPLEEFTESVRKNVAITWYRTKLPPESLKSLHAKSDLKGGAQTLGYLALLVGTGFAAWWALHHAPWHVTTGFVFLYGMVSAFLINAVHELGHGTVFRTRWRNSFFCHVFAFLGWILTLNPFLRFLYWQMNHHIEHHMFAAVPCYNLHRLHGMIQHDLPPTPKGLVGVWTEIDAILRMQQEAPSYQYEAPLPHGSKFDHHRATTGTPIGSRTT
jgi:fatty acid desaturase